ncbi:RNA polymerase sigma factor [Paenibacillus spongiae]|uniref:Sigma-70 family RNA polymerase sigma factor n=1 Tax=Paenibacillus spongiae TaxID=2909671 RepID=A0ABY5S7C1_9BACL|nr:sigma-70 family RNA polymerase sigma factor [Paenibacillus spongiae]UVI28440.1 sigma-70 family RNA polymerase sigma factor [Paenibacillus spongiae]
MDIEELSDLIKQHGKAIYGFCYKLAGNKADTDDLYQETFLKAMEVRHKMDANQNPKGFLISIAIQLRKNKRRKFAWRQRIAPVAELNEAVDKACRPCGEATPEDAVLSHELRGILQAAADRLGDKLKIPLYMHYTAEMSVDEIASALNIPPGTVKSRLYQARKAMKKTLEVESP